MKTANRIAILLALISLGLATTLSAAEKKIGGPKGGRLLENDSRRSQPGTTMGGETFRRAGFQMR